MPRWRAEARAKPWAKIATDGDVFVKSFSSQHLSIDPASAHACMPSPQPVVDTI